MDEAQEMSEEDLEALMPTTSAAPKKNPQWIFTGTPPGPNANGEIFTRVRREALAGGSKRLSWHEWSMHGRQHVEVIKNQRGVGWVVDALVKFNANAPCIILLDPAGAAGGLLPDLEAAGLTVHKTNAREMAQACVGFHHAFTEGDAVHLEQPILTTALAGAGKRDLAGLFAWTRRDPNTDITPLVSATLALWGFAHSAAQPKKKPAKVYAF
jgi:hypothetical protein